MSVKQPRNVIFCGAKTQYENLGDALINRELISRLRQYGNLIIDCDSVPDWFVRDLEISSSEIFKANFCKFSLYVMIYSILNFFKGNKKIYLIVKPGHIYGRFSYIELIKTGYFAILKVFGVRICRFGVSVGPYSRSMELLERFKALTMYSYTVRDSLSENYLKQLGISKVKFFPDLAWLVPEDKEIPSFIDSPYIVLSFRSSTLSTGSSDYVKSISKALKKVIASVQNPSSLKLVISYQVIYDREVCVYLRDEIKKEFGESYDIIFLDKRLDFNSSRRLYSNANFVISNRLHVLMLAMRYGSLGIPLIDREKHIKIMGVYDHAGWNQIVLDVNEVNRELDVAKFLDFQRLDAYRNPKEIFLEYSRQADSSFSQVFN